MDIKIEVKTSAHTDYCNDTVTFQNIWRNGYIEINHNGALFEVEKSDLRKVLTILCED
ncbi:hypothetical protein [Bacillus sp. JJ722]|uniref:hypothetical protein n=1 Tax=Bacillus sp. JJ722 TaxID=3122973 RepID=UPI003000DEEE